MEDEKFSGELTKEQDDYQQVPADAIIANFKQVRPENMSFIIWWKTRRNYNLAVKSRLRYGSNAVLTMNLKTMSVVTDNEIMRKFYSPLERVVHSPRTKDKRKSKGLRYA